VRACRNARLNDPNPDVFLCSPVPPAVCSDSMSDMSATLVRVCWIDKYGGNHSVTLSGLKWNETATP